MAPDFPGVQRLAVVGKPTQWRSNNLFPLPCQPTSIPLGALNRPERRRSGFVSSMGGSIASRFFRRLGSTEELVSYYAPGYVSSWEVAAGLTIFAWMCRRVAGYDAR